MKTDLKWFHVSDMHFRGFQSFNRKGLADCLLDAARENLGRGWKPDFVAISGDIAYNAEEGQYSDATIPVPERFDTYPPRTEPPVWEDEAIDRMKKKIG